VVVQGIGGVASASGPYRAVVGAAAIIIPHRLPDQQRSIPARSCEVGTRTAALRMCGMTPAGM